MRVMPMSKEVKKGTKNSRFIIIFFILMIIMCAFCFIWMIRESAEESRRAGVEMDMLYLRELTAQTIGHFQTSIDSQFSQLRTAMAALQDKDLEDEAALLSYLERIQAYNNFNFFALVDADGNYYCKDGVFPGASKISFLGKLLQGQSGQLSYNETILGENMILIGDCITPADYGEHRIVAVIAGLDVDIINNQLSLKREDAKTYSSMVERSGRFIINNSYENELSKSTNILSKMQKYAQFESAGDLDTIKADLSAGRSDLVVYDIDGEKQYMYYAPITGTDWYLLTVIPYEIVDETISDLIGNLNRNSIGIMIFISALLSMVFLYFYISISKDEQKLREASILAQEARLRAENASRAKSEFLSRMSHEIRTPMNGIIGMGTIALQNIHDPDKAARYLKKQAVSSQYLLTLINDVLDMSKIESGKIELKNEDFDFFALVEGLGAIYESQAQTRGIDYATVMAEDAQRWLVGDSLRLNQILSNLLSNAMKFTPVGGSVRLNISVASGDATQVWLRFEVSDTGCGIARENFDKVFESFEQENASVTSNYGGTGLGLAIVKRFAELMGGHICLESEVGAGSTFIVELPFKKAQLPETGTAPEALLADRATGADAYDFKGKHILIVEDNEINREIVLEMIHVTGADIHTAVNGREALDLFRASEPGFYDLILMDVHMPVLDGHEASKQIRVMERDDAASVPIIAMTANAFAEDEAACYAAGMNGYVSKPVDVHVLYSKAAQLMNINIESGGSGL